MLTPLWLNKGAFQIKLEDKLCIYNTDNHRSAISAFCPFKSLPVLSRIHLQLDNEKSIGRQFV